MIKSGTKFATKNGCRKVAIKKYVETEVSTKLMKDPSTSFLEALIQCVESTHFPLTVFKKQTKSNIFVVFMNAMMEKDFPCSIWGAAMPIIGLPPWDSTAF